MGCRSSVEAVAGQEKVTEIDGRLEADGRPGGERSDGGSSCELQRTVSQMTAPIRIPSRHLTREELAGMREAARAFASEAAGPEPVAREESSPRRPPGRGGSRLGSRIFRVSNRMSSLASSDRSRIVAGLERSAAERGRGGPHRMGLEGRLESFGMKMKEMEGDGNCQFRSLAHNLFGEQAHHAVTRRAAVAHMRKHRDFFSVLFESAREFKEYLSDMARNKTWGDELTLRAVVEAYGCEAHVITSEPANWYLVYQPEYLQEGPDPKVAACPRGVDPPRRGKQVFLSYISPVHYNSIVAARAAP